MCNRPRSAFVSVLACLFAIAAGAASAQDFPARPIRIIVANNPGTTADLVPRVVAPEMSKVLGQPVVVENRPGADSLIGYEYVAKQPADGYTMASVLVPGLVTLPLTMKDLRFDPLKDLYPVADIIELKLVLGSSSKLPWKTLREFVAKAKAEPGKLNYGATGANVRLSTESLIGDLGLNMTYVPYAGGGPYIQALAGGEVHFGIIGEAQAISLGEKFRVLAQTGAQRSPVFRDVPTFAELGHPQIAGVIASLNVPAGTPRSVIDKLYAAASAALQHPDVKARFSKLQMEILNRAPEAAAKSLASQAKLFAEIAKKTGFQAR